METSEGEVEVGIQENREDADLRSLALDIAAGKIFGSWDIDPDQQGTDLRVVFMPIALGARLPPNVGHIYEYISEAGPRSINGYPSFMSFKVLTEEDGPKLKSFIDEVLAQQEAFKEEG